MVAIMSPAHGCPHPSRAVFLALAALAIFSLAIAKDRSFFENENSSENYLTLKLHFRDFQFDADWAPLFPNGGTVADYPLQETRACKIPIVSEKVKVPAEARSSEYVAISVDKNLYAEVVRCFVDQVFSAPPKEWWCKKNEKTCREHRLFVEAKEDASIQTLKELNKDPFSSSVRDVHNVSSTTSSVRDVVDVHIIPSAEEERWMKEVAEGGSPKKPLAKSRELLEHSVKMQDRPDHIMLRLGLQKRDRLDRLAKEKALEDRLATILRKLPSAFLPVGRGVGDYLGIKPGRIALLAQNAAEQAERERLATERALATILRKLPRAREAVGSGVGEYLDIKPGRIALLVQNTAERHDGESQVRSSTS